MLDSEGHFKDVFSKVGLWRLSRSRKIDALYKVYQLTFQANYFTVIILYLQYISSMLKALSFHDCMAIFTHAFIVINISQNFSLKNLHSTVLYSKFTYKVSVADISNSSTTRIIWIDARFPYENRP